MRTFVCIVPETGRRITTDNEESLQRRERHRAGLSIRLFRRTRAKQAYVKGLKGRNVWHVRISLTPIKSFLPCDVTYAISGPRPSAILSHGGQRSRLTIAQAEGLGRRLGLLGYEVQKHYSF